MFEIGDFVSFIDEDIDGLIVAIKGDKITVEDKDGFHIDCSPNEIIKTGQFDDELSGYIDSGSMRRIISEKEANKPKYSQKRQNRGLEDMTVVDLHIEQILPNYKHLDSGDILEYQLNRARYKMEEAISKKAGGIVFIHGHGNGVLKYELKRMLADYKCDMRDADYVKYGGGALEVTIF